MSRRRGSVAASVVGIAGAAVLLLPGAVEAAVPGEVCLLNQSTFVYDGGYVGGGYQLPAGAGFRIVNYASNGYYGHGNGYPDGYITPRSVIDQSTCTS